MDTECHAALVSGSGYCKFYLRLNIVCCGRGCAVGLFLHSLLHQLCAIIQSPRILVYNLATHHFQTEAKFTVGRPSLSVCQHHCPSTLFPSLKRSNLQLDLPGASRSVNSCLVTMQNGILADCCLLHKHEPSPSACSCLRLSNF